MSEPITDPLPQTTEEIVQYIAKALERQAEGFNAILRQLPRKNEELSLLNKDLETRLRAQSDKLEELANQLQGFPTITTFSVKLAKPSDFAGDKDYTDAKT